MVRPCVGLGLAPLWQDRVRFCVRIILFQNFFLK